jgi:hypothetical protein
MRSIAAVLFCLSLAAVPAMANTGAKDAGKEDASAAANTAAASTAQPKEAVKMDPAALASELEDLRSMLQSQTQELEAQRAALRAQQLKMDALEESLRARTASVAASAPAEISAAATPAVNSTLAMPANPSSPGAAPSAALAASPQGAQVPDSPLQLRIGSAYITPIGFLDFTSVWRSHVGGSGIGTNFAGIPYGNVVTNNLTEFRLSMQNSRIGFRVDALVKGAHVIGYMESDYLGNNPGNVAVSSNSNTLRSRLYWVDVLKDKWEVFGGQTWSLITPGRSGISPLPGNLFYTQNIDVNYQLGLVWGRIPEFRFVYHPTDKAAFAVALDSPEQYVGGSAGGPGITFPAALNTPNNPFPGEVNTGGNTLTVPNVAPDVIAKLAFDPSSKVHFEVGGLERQFRVYDQLNGIHYSKTGGGGFLNLNVQLFPGFRVLTNNFYSDGGGRYIFGQAPDLIVHANGSLSPIHSGSSVSGFEFTHKNAFLYAYYGGLYVQRNVAFDANGTSFIGYGVPTSSSGSQNRTVQEGTLGFNQTLWRDAKFGALNLMGQYSFLDRRPWAVASGASKLAHLNMVFLNLRYTLPGSAPALK